MFDCQFLHRKFLRRAVAASVIAFFGAAITAAAAELSAQDKLMPVTIAAAKDRSGESLPETLKLLSRVSFHGSLSLNWRNVGPRKPGFETQIQDEVYLSDMYFGISGPLFDGLPFLLELHMPTGSQGRVQLNQVHFSYERVENLKLQFGKFIVPFGRYNELYRPDEYLAVTRPLLYASADSLDLVVRPNSPRPPLSYGYTDVGARVSYFPPSLKPYIPAEVTAFVVNGLGETSNRQRTFPDPENLGIKPPQANGVAIDFGHRNNNLADNNNFKSVGGRVVFGLGDVRLPWPLPEESADLQGMTLGFSGMGGQYDLEGVLNYQMYGVDFSFDYEGFDISGEYMYNIGNMLIPILASSTTLTSPLNHKLDFEINSGYFIQASFPILRKPPWGRRLSGFVVYNQIFRRGPLTDLLLNYVDNATFTIYPSLNAITPGAPRLNRRIVKYTAGINYQLTHHFFLKGEYSYWVMNRSSTRSPTSLGLVDIYQFATTMSMSF